MSSLKRFWHGFNAVMKRVGNFQARVLLTVFYLVIAAPFGLGVRFTSDPLRLRRHQGQSGWVPRESRDATLEWGHRQY